MTNPQSGYKKGWEKGVNLMKTADSYNLSVLSPSFKKRLAQEGVTLRQTPQQFIGAYSARLVADVTNDGTRMLWWRYNQPEGIKHQVARASLGDKLAKEMGPVKTGLAFTAALAPSLALTGSYDITNIGEQFRPEGFAQRYAEPGSEDRRESSQPGLELFERLFLQRSGGPLKYETAKAEIPSLTPERYGNYMRSYYQDPGVLGVLKATPENLQGYPEARLLGFPITIPSVTAAAGGIAGMAAGARIGGPKGRARKTVASALAGSLAGALTGNVVNEMIATANRPKLPTIGEYSQGMQ
jgi:hypothetical protein